MKKFGLIGHPIAHSLSPALFNAAFGGKYTYDLIEGSDFKKSYEKFMAEYDAINVTAPFKEPAFEAADIHSQECIAIGAANILTLDRQNNIVHAANSDIMGVTGSLEFHETRHDSCGKALIAGCGGAAMAAAYAMWKELGYETYIINRSLDKAHTFADRMREAIGDDGRLHVAGLDRFCELFRMADVVIYTLPIAIPELKKLSSRDIRGGRFWQKAKKKVILEANYKDPSFTSEMMEDIRSINPEISFISGKEWLLHQAVGAYRHFVDDEPDIEQMRKVISAT